MKKIAILTSGHPPFDDRIYWKFGLSLTNAGYLVKIICSIQEINHQSGNLSITGFSDKNLDKRNKISKFYEFLKILKPDVIICSEPLTVIPSSQYKRRNNQNCKIILDITEWYPENVTDKFRAVKKFISYILLFLLNIAASNLSDHLIIGELGKRRRYDFIAPFKRKIIIGYYPVLRFFNYAAPKFDGKNFNLCYAGVLNFKRGIVTLTKAAKHIAETHKELNVKLKLIGKFNDKTEEKRFLEMISDTGRLEIQMVDWTSYSQISNKLSDADICFDLRTRDFIYNNSLPIKIFEYMAAGKPFIFSNIKPLRQELDCTELGLLVNPDNLQEVIQAIEFYLINLQFMIEHGKNGRKLIEEKLNWENESGKLLSLIESITNT